MNKAVIGLEHIGQTYYNGENTTVYRLPVCGVFMKTMFFPESVAIIGVSNAPGNNGRVIVENMDRFGYKGRLYLVGGKKDVVVGRETYTDVAGLPEAVDLAVVLIPARGLADLLHGCGRKGIKRLVIETGGFSEFGEDRRVLEEEIRGIALQWGLKFIGPNCVGIINPESGLILPFYPLYPHEVKAGPVSIISQSGGLIHDIMMLCHIEKVGMSKLVSIGNKLMYDESDMLEYFISDPDTGIIGLYLENIRDGRRFMDLARSTDKPIVLLKSNRSPGATQIARFHTSALAGDDRVVEEAVKQAGIHRVRDLKELVDTFKTFALPPPKGRRLAVIARSGGHAVLSADAVYLHGFTLASFSDRFFGVLSEKTRVGIIRRTNPLDLGDVFDFGVYLELVENILMEEGVDGLLILHSYALGVDLEPSRKFVRSCSGLARKYGKPIVFCTIAHKEDWFSLREASDNLPVYTHVDDALAALHRSFEHFGRLDREAGKGTPERVFRSEQTDGTAPSPLSGGSQTAPVVFELLKSYGFTVADYRLVASLDECLKGGDEIGYPVALKNASPDLTHKTEAGGVILGIEDEVSLEQAFSALKAGSCLLQKMAGRGCEIILGGRSDPEFGPVIMCGMGGIFVEVYRDVAVRVAPVDRDEAGRMIEELKGATILKGFRGEAPYDREFLVTAIVNASRLLADHPEIEVLDMNPLILFHEGEGGMVVDAKVRVRGLGLHP